MVIRAGIDNSSTRTSLDFDGSSSSAKVVWNSGDAIRIIAYSGGRYQSSVFTTADEGVNVGEFSCHSWNPVNDGLYAAIYPADKFKGFSYDSSRGFIFGLVVPPVQQAVKGGVEKGLIRSFSAIGDATDMSGNITFKNALAMLRFRITGASASQVKKVKLVANATIAGDCMAYVSEDRQYIDFDTNRWFLPQEYGPMSNVELTGDFQDGADYYFTTLPCTSSGFSLLFFDAADEMIARYSDKNLTLTRSHIVDLGTIRLDEAFGEPNPNVIKYMSHSKGSKPVTIAIVGEGFTASEQDKFVTLAKSATDFLFSTEPFKSYKDYFNVYLMKAVSKESGASITDGNGNITTRRDSYFEARWGANSYNDLSSNYDKVWGFVSARCPEILSGEKTINEVAVAMIINDSRYGGRCYSNSSGRCVAHIPYTDNGGGLAWSYPDNVAADDAVVGSVRIVTNAERDELGRSRGDWRNTFLHEFGGHGFSRLSDEYWYGTSYSTGTYVTGHDWPVPMGLNISGTYDKVPWQEELLDRQAELVARDDHYSRVGRFQGGDVMICNRWRCEKISCMIDNRQYFSAWQRCLIVKRIMSLAGETFSIDDFFAKDVTVDPLRDVKASGAPAAAGMEIEHASYTEYPLLPPPVLLY